MSFRLNSIDYVSIGKMIRKYRKTKNLTLLKLAEMIDVSESFIGENCWINQQVTIGFKDGTHAPTIDNNVQICAGDIIVGDVHLGDGCKVGAGAVVVKGVPPGVTVAGVPAKIIKCAE